MTGIIKLRKLQQEAEKAGQAFCKANTGEELEVTYNQLEKALNAFNKAKRDLYRGSGVFGNEPSYE
jgi:hypothetical protein